MSNGNHGVHGFGDFALFLDTAAANTDIDPSAPFTGVGVDYDATSDNNESGNSSSFDGNNFTFSWSDESDQSRETVHLVSQLGTADFSKAVDSESSNYNDLTAEGNYSGGQTETTTDTKLVEVSHAQDGDIGSIPVLGGGPFGPQFGVVPESFLFATDHQVVTTNYSNTPTDSIYHQHVDDVLTEFSVSPNGVQFTQDHTVSDYSSDTHYLPGLTVTDSHYSEVDQLIQAGHLNSLDLHAAVGMKG